MTPEPGICTVDTCDAPTELYLCNTCVQELRDDWAKIPDLVPVLQMIARGEEKAQALSTAPGGGGGHRGGSKPPMNLGALQLAADLEHAHTITPEELAQTPEAAKRKTRWHAWIERADVMVNGETEDVESKQNIARYKLGALQPMTGPELVTWFREQLDLKLTLGRIRHWAHRGHITRTNTEGHPKYSPVSVYIAYTERSAHA